jgi:hypothetical protein
MQERTRIRRSLRQRSIVIVGIGRLEVGHRPMFVHKVRTAARRRRRLNNGCFFGARYAQRRRGERALSALADVPGGYTGAVRRTRLALRRDTSAQP